MMAPTADSTVAPRDDATTRDDGEVLGVAARLCWHTMAICHALEGSVGELTIAVADVADHADAILELAVGLAQVETHATPSPGTGERRT